MAKDFTKRSVLDKEFPRKSDEENLTFYNQIRNDFKTGDLLFFSGNHWLSSMIRWRSKSAWSHVGMVVVLEEIDRVFLAESILGVGVRFLPISFVLKNYDGHQKPYNGRVAWARNCEVEEEVEVKQKLKEFCMDNLTKQYDTREYWRILWRTLVSSRKLFKDEKYTCAEYIYEAYQYAGLKVPHEKAFFITPGSFWSQKSVILQGILI